MLVAASLCFGTKANPPFAKIVDFPKKLDFAGERVPLENRDTRESLIREVLTTSYMHSRTFMTLLYSRRYLPEIEPILAQQGMPEDLIFLCMAESGLNPEAVSSAGAAGLWQLMPATAREYGLIVDSDIDERFHIEKSTEAACKYLKSSYDRLGTWTAAAAGYNLGVTGTQTRISKQGTEGYYDSFFPEETRRYIFRILSFKLLLDNPGRYGFDIPDDEYFPPLTDCKTMEVTGAEIDWCAVALEKGTNYKALRELNPWIRSYGYKNPNGYTFTVKFPVTQ